MGDRSHLDDRGFTLIEAVIVDVDVVDQAVDLVAVPQWGADQCAKDWRIQLRDAAASDEAGRTCAQ